MNAAMTYLFFAFQTHIFKNLVDTTVGMFYLKDSKS